MAFLALPHGYFDAKMIQLMVMYVCALSYMFLLLFQMRKMLAFNMAAESAECPCREDFRDVMQQFHVSLLQQCQMLQMYTEVDSGSVFPTPPEQSLYKRLLALIWKSEEIVKTEDGSKEILPGVYDSMFSMFTQHWMHLWICYCIICAILNMCCS